MLACGDAATNPASEHAGTGSGASAGQAGSEASAGGAGWASGGQAGSAQAGSAGRRTQEGPTRYGARALRSPLTRHVMRRVRAIAALEPSRSDNVFIKVGDSASVSRYLLYCFAGRTQPQYQLELGGRSELLPSIQFFRAGPAAGTTPFDRKSTAAKVGHSAGWVIRGNPSPLESEITALNPRFAFVGYGTNDMSLGATYTSAMTGFYRHLNQLLEQLETRGIIPIVTALPPRRDNSAAARWVPSYDSITRGLAEARQLPYISLYHATQGLPNAGLSRDGLHANVYLKGGVEPCIFNAAGLQFGYNVRNLLSIQALSDMRQVLSAQPAPATGTFHTGNGLAEAPFSVDTLPFTHSADTSQLGQRQIHRYEGCQAAQDESGPELLYRLELSVATALRAVVLSPAGVDVDLHLLAEHAQGTNCIARADQIIQRSLQPGTYYFSVDTFKRRGKEQSGRYLLLIQPCETGDPECSDA